MAEKDLSNYINTHPISARLQLQQYGRVIGDGESESIQDSSSIEENQSFQANKQYREKSKLQTALGDRDSIKNINDFFKLSPKDREIFASRNPIYCATLISQARIKEDKQNQKLQRLQNELKEAIQELNKVFNADLAPILSAILVLQHKESLYVPDGTDIVFKDARFQNMDGVLQNIFLLLENKPTLLKDGFALLKYISRIPPYLRPDDGKINTAKFISQSVYNAIAKLIKCQEEFYQQQLKCDESSKNIQYYYQMKDICFKYGLPKELHKPELFYTVNSCIFSTVDNQMVTPELLKKFFKEISIANDDLIKIRKVLGKYCIKIDIKKPGGIQYISGDCFYAITHNKTAFQAQKYEQQNIKSTTVNGLDLLQNPIQEMDKTIVNESLKELSISTISDFLFWSQLTACVYGKGTKDKMFLIYFEKEHLCPIFVENIKKLFGEPFCFENTFLQETPSKIMTYQVESNHIGIISIDNMKMRRNELLEKLVMGEAITLKESIPIWMIEYRNTMPVLVYTYNRKSFEELKGFCKKKDIICSDFEVMEKNAISNLSASEFTSLKWCFLAGYYHKPNKKDSPQKSKDDLLNEFISIFCEITGEEDDKYRSGDFYSQYVKAYYEANRSPVIGSKVFNKFLKSYCPDKLRVAYRHVSASNNVQHIIGMKFDETRFKQYLEEHQAEEEKQQRIFDSYIEDIFSYVEKDFAGIYVAIAASIDSNQSPLQ